MDDRRRHDPNESNRADEGLLKLLWPRDWPELLVFGFIVVTGAALIGGALSRVLFG